MYFALTRAHEPRQLHHVMKTCLRRTRKRLLRRLHELSEHLIPSVHSHTGDSVAPRRNKVESPGVHIDLLHIVRRGATDPLARSPSLHSPSRSDGPPGVSCIFVYREGGLSCLGAASHPPALPRLRSLAETAHSGCRSASCCPCRKWLSCPPFARVVIGLTRYVAENADIEDQLPPPQASPEGTPRRRQCYYTKIPTACVGLTGGSGCKL